MTDGQDDRVGPMHDDCRRPSAGGGQGGVSATEVTPIAAVEETVQGLFGAARCNDGTTIWCRARKVLERQDRKSVV